MTKIRNVVFHNITDSDKTEDIYQIEAGKFKRIFDYLEKTGDFRIYFDDGYMPVVAALNQFIPEELRRNVVLAITPECLGKSGYMTNSDVRILFKSGFQIASHGYSHSALAIYDETDEYLLDTPAGGKYQNAPRGKTHQLSENEVLFQYIESKKALENLLKNPVYEFVFPYGLYNKNVLDVNNRSAIYKTLSTCDDELDVGNPLRPRHLVYSNKTADEIIEEIKALKVY
jgi:peptidoglycan/xylan/chitin deacetylase (PgdA/CDA1 family)